MFTMFHNCFDAAGQGAADRTDLAADAAAAECRTGDRYLASAGPVREPLQHVERCTHAEHRGHLHPVLTAARALTAAGAHSAPATPAHFVAALQRRYNAREVRNAVTHRAALFCAERCAAAAQRGGARREAAGAGDEARVSRVRL
jgi:hypothetical protein